MFSNWISSLLSSRKSRKHLTTFLVHVLVFFASLAYIIKEISSLSGIWKRFRVTSSAILFTIESRMAITLCVLPCEGRHGSTRQRDTWYLFPRRTRSRDIRCFVFLTSDVFYLITDTLISMRYNNIQTSKEIKYIWQTSKQVTTMQYMYPTGFQCFLKY